MTGDAQGTSDGAVAVIGAGNVGATIARRLAGAGRQVAIGVRRPDAPAVTALVAELGDRAWAGLPAAAIAKASVVVLAVPGSSASDVVTDHAAALVGKVVVDATNDLAAGHDPGALSTVPHLQRTVPNAFAFRAFNSVGWEVMADPHLGADLADLPFAGPDGGPRATVEGLIADVGFRPVYVGADASAHAAVDALATLWFSLAFGQGRGRRLAFRILSDPPAAPAAPPR